MRRPVIALVMFATLVFGTAATGVAVRDEVARLSDFRVSVQFDGLPAELFRSVSGLSVRVEVVEIQEGGANEGVRKLIGRTKWPNLVLKQGFTGRPSTLQQWAFRVAGGANERRNGTIVLHDDKLRPIATWKLKNAWPAKWQGPDLDASSNEIAMEEIEITHEGLTLSSP